MKNRKILSVILTFVMMFAFVSLISVPVFAVEGDTQEAVMADAVAEDAAEAEAGDNSVISAKAIAAALAVGVVGVAGAIGMAIAIGKSVEGMARQPEASGKINSAMMLGLVFIETVIIYALIVAILVIFVL